MFRTRPDHRPETVQVFVEGRALMVPEGSSAATAILISGLSSIRETPVSGSPRMPWCMMGVCLIAWPKLMAWPIGKPAWCRSQQACASPGNRARERCGDEPGARESRRGAT